MLQNFCNRFNSLCKYFSSFCKCLNPICKCLNPVCKYFSLLCKYFRCPHKYLASSKNFFFQNITIVSQDFFLLYKNHKALINVDIYWLRNSTINEWNFFFIGQYSANFSLYISYIYLYYLLFFFLINDFIVSLKIFRIFIRLFKKKKNSFQIRKKNQCDDIMRGQIFEGR